MRPLAKLAVVALGALALGACGPKSVFKLSADENNRYALDQTLARRQLPDQPSPVNVARQPRVFVVAAGKPRTIIAYDLAGDQVMWKFDADVQSRIAVGGDFVVTLEGTQLVARDQTRGVVRWKAAVPGTFVGAAADRDRAYLVYKEGAVYWLASIDGGSGKQLWNMDSGGKLGAPQAQGGLVYVPFLDQWLAIIDGRTGEQLTRLRGLDEQISMLRTTSQTVYYGSKQGVFRLDAHSATGTRDKATYGTVKIPPQLDLTTYGRDAYDPIQQAYSAADRTRVLYAAEPSEAGPMKMTGDGYAIHYFRYVLGYGTDGALRWAYAHPRVDLVASEHTGGAIAGISAAGDIIALDPRTGALRAQKKLGTTTQVLGATFDA
ncbi:MAG: PQQ-binding-like beta-propeller repeat protein, partial [Deltaproteobacteria bacterium]|nr:PQQ-binding-like beta-propeller repeat protein [Deltaproteobacteria bacterium]